MECAYLALFLASDMSRYITGAAIPVDGALSAGSKNVTSWKHPEILTGGKLNADSTIAAIMENTDAKAIVDKYLPGFAENEQAKAAYGLTFKALAPMLGLPEDVVTNMLGELEREYPKVCGLSFLLAIKITSKLSNFILHQFGGLHKLWDTPEKAEE